MASLKKISDGIAHVNATFNNTIITVTDVQGNALGWASAGQSYSGSRQSTPYAAQMTAEKVAEIVKKYHLEALDIIVKGPGPGRESSIRALGSHFTIKSITDQSSIPHNGCRDPKERRV